MAQDKTRVRAKFIGVEKEDVVGYYNHERRRGGQEFYLNRPRDFSGRWMEYVSGPKPPIISKREEEAAIEEAKQKSSQVLREEDAPPVLDPDEVEGGEAPEEVIEESPEPKKDKQKKPYKGGRY